MRPESVHRPSEDALAINDRLVAFDAPNCARELGERLGMLMPYELKRSLGKSSRSPESNSRGISLPQQDVRIESLDATADAP